MSQPNTVTHLMRLALARRDYWSDERLRAHAAGDEARRALCSTFVLEHDELIASMLQACDAKSAAALPPELMPNSAELRAHVVILPA